MSMRCLGRVEGCNNNECQKQVDATGDEPRHIEEDTETVVIREQQEKKAKSKAKIKP